MKILFLSQILPYPLDSGVKFRNYYTLRQFAANHDVTLLCFVRPDNTPDQIAHLNDHYCRVHTVLMNRSTLRDTRYLLQSTLTRRSFIISRDTNKSMHAKLTQLLDEAERDGQPYHALHCDQLWMAQYALQKHAIKKVLDQHNVVHMIPQRMAQHESNSLKRLFLEQEWRKLADYEVSACRGFDHILTVSSVDRDALLKLLGASHPPITALPICLDPQATPQVTRASRPTMILHLGTMFWPPNVDGVLWFAKEVFPIIHREIPNTRFAIVGKNPPSSVLDLSGQPGIEVPGYVEDPTSYLEECAAFVVPLRAGGGMRVKIIDAWLRGVPIVSTTIGAEGIDTLPGENILIADQPVSFAQAVIRLINDQEYAQELTANGRAWAEHYYNWRLIYPQLDEIYASLSS